MAMKWERKRLEKLLDELMEPGAKATWRQHIIRILTTQVNSIPTVVLCSSSRTPLAPSIDATGKVM